MILLLIFFKKNILTPSLLKDFNGRIISLFRFFKSFTNALTDIISPIESISIELRSPIFLIGPLEKIFCFVGSSSFIN